MAEGAVIIELLKSMQSPTMAFTLTDMVELDSKLESLKGFRPTRSNLQLDR